LTWWHSYWNSD